MNPPSPKRATFLEYFLYAAIILETALAAFVYKTIVRDAGLSTIKIYLGVLYVAFLAWAMLHLHILHRKRKRAPEPVRKDRTPPGQILGLTLPQVTIVAIVFVAAVVTFSWAFSAR